MKFWLISCWESLRANFWFVPTFMVTGAVALSLAMINLDKVAAHGNGIAALGWTFTRGPEGSRALLSTVAGSMMTITSVTFSITIVALQLASTQFGPRLLRNFMRDRGNQVSLGTFIATFAYCLLILRTVNGTEGQRFVPHISVTVGLLMAMMSLGVLIYFIHHAAASIQAESVIANVGRDLDEAIARLYPVCLGGGPARGVSEEHPPPDFGRDGAGVAADRSDYIQSIDIDRLVEVAREHDLVIGIPHGPGKFLMEGAELARVSPGGSLDEGIAAAIRGAFYLGQIRTLTQDVEFAIDQLVEIAVRALSPGVNDPFTAVNCVDRLGAALVKLAGREIPSARRFDDEGRLRVVASSSTIGGLVNGAFDQVRQAARDDVAVTIRLLETIASVAAQARGEGWRAALRRQAEMIHRGSHQALPEQEDRHEADERFRDVIRALESGVASGEAREPETTRSHAWDI